MNGYRVFLLLCLSFEFPSIESNCNKFWKELSFLITKHTTMDKDKIFGNISTSSRIADGDVLSLSCIAGRVVNGSKVLICQNNTWNDNEPNCIQKPVTKTSNKHTLPWIIIGPSSGAGVVFIVIVITISVLMIRRKKERNKHNNPLPNGTPGHTDLSTETFARDTNDYYSQIDRPFKTGAKRDDSEQTSTVNQDNHRYSDAVSLIGSSASVLGISNTPVYKIWTCRRTRRKFIRAENIEQLKRKAAVVYQYDNPVRLALEEDGTGVDDDDILASCSDKVLVVLSRNEQWVDPGGIPVIENYQKYTFDVCSQDRSVRKLILAENLKDLTRQAMLVVGYSIESICLEEDGTCIEDEETLLIMSGKTLMLLGKEQSWTPTQHEIPKIEYPSRLLITEDKDKLTFKIWSADYTQKKIIKANNCIDLHLKAAKILNLALPLQIRVKDKNIIISSDKVLTENKDNVLIAAQSNPPRWIGSNRELSQTTAENENKDNLFDNENKEKNISRQSGFEQTATHRYDRGPVEIRQNQQNQSAVTKYNPPDVVMSTDLSSITMPARYEPSSQLHNSVTNSNTNGNDHYQSEHIGSYVSETPSNLKSKSANNSRPVSSEEKSFSHSNLLEQITNEYPYRNEDSKLKEYYRQDGSPPVLPQLGFHNPQNLKEQKYFYGNQIKTRSELTENDNMASLPYSNLQPLHRAKQIDQIHPQRKRSDETNNHGLPYSNLEPVHRKGRPKNNFEIMRHDSASPFQNVDTQNAPSSLYRQPSFLVTGGAKQSSQSDVLF